MALEVIEQNEAGTRLYRKCGFESTRRLVGFVFEDPKGAASESLREIDPREAGQAVTRHGLSDLPWQISGESIVHHTPPTRAFKLDSAYAVVANLHTQDAAIYSLLVEPSARGKGQASALLRALCAAFPEKKWHIPALCPEELGGLFEKAGFQKEKLSQWQMKLGLSVERDA
jgi:ribosomal protein S18 acetylase RimI-like enzyme